MMTRFSDRLKALARTPPPAVFVRRRGFARARRVGERPAPSGIIEFGDAL